jgi:hypothetical protein
MDAFENLIATLFERDGNWTQTSVKVNLTKQEKVAIGRKTSPRWEIDVVAYDASKNHIKVIECKSYFDSRGVGIDAFDGSNPTRSNRYKLFNDDVLRGVVFNRLKIQFTDLGRCRANPRVTLALAAGRIHGSGNDLHAYFKEREWDLFGPRWLRGQLQTLSDSGYENSMAAIVAKALLRP